MIRTLRIFSLLTATSLLAAAALAGDFAVPALDAGNAKADGQPVANALSPGLAQAIVAEGKMKIENGSATNPFYGFAGDGPMAPAAGDVQTKTHNVEATKTEPDKNTYLVLAGAKGPDAAYDYGTHFLFQGHENGVHKDDRPQGYVTRINLDADEAHRVTLIADRDTNGNSLPFIDGSAWNPFARRLLLTGEEGDEGGLWQVTAEFPGVAEDLRGVAGIAAYEGVQVDKEGNLWLVEDAGGKKGKSAKHARQPNSFLFRLIPADKTDLTKGGRLEVLQVMAADGKPVAFTSPAKDDDKEKAAQLAAAAADAGIAAQGVKDQYSYGKTLKTLWIAIHDTAKDGTSPFDANKLAKAAGGTPMKRPENGQFRPGSNFTEYYFTATGDTNAETEAGSEGGGFGGIFRLKQSGAAAAEGELSLVYRGDKDHSGFDNLAFFTASELAIVEDAGDGLHSQRQAFDAGYLLDVTKDYSTGAQPVRFLVNGRDDAATVDSALLAKAEENGFQNDGDNEITGIHISDGDASVAGLIGAKEPTPFANGWRVFYTRQHGNNETYEITAK
jgi:hypothetical protein